MDWGYVSVVGSSLGTVGMQLYMDCGHVSVVGMQLYRDCGHVAVMTSCIWTVGMQLYMDCGHAAVYGLWACMSPLWAYSSIGTVAMSPL